jgi:predicted DCC family thiol-disulfide oxidoreductase YuxK
MAAGGAWGLVGRVLLIPPVSWLAALGYELVAHNRSKLPGATDACALPK